MLQDHGRRLQAMAAIISLPSRPRVVHKLARLVDCGGDQAVSLCRH